MLCLRVIEVTRDFVIVYYLCSTESSIPVIRCILHHQTAGKYPPPFNDNGQQ